MPLIDRLVQFLGIDPSPHQNHDKQVGKRDKMASSSSGNVRSIPPPPPMVPSSIDTEEPQFPLLDLPVELQRLVFYHYFGGTYDITVDSERLTMLRSKFHVLGMPSTALLRVSKHVNRHATSVRRDSFSGRLILNSVFILIPLGKQSRFEWLRENTTILHFSDSSVHPERWSRYWDSFCSLRRLEICFPKVKEVECGGGDGVGGGTNAPRGIGLAEILDGKVDDVLLGSLDLFRMCLVNQLREDKLEVVVRQKFCAKGRDGEMPAWDGLVVSLTVQTCLCCMG